MRVQLDNGRESVDLEVLNGSTSFLSLVIKALKSMDYSQDDLVSMWDIMDIINKDKK